MGNSKMKKTKPMTKKTIPVKRDNHFALKGCDMQSCCNKSRLTTVSNCGRRDIDANIIHLASQGKTVDEIAAMLFTGKTTLIKSDYVSGQGVVNLETENPVFLSFKRLVARVIAEKE